MAEREQPGLHVSLHAAVAENGIIGRDGDLPWRLSTDLKRFKAATLGKPVIMGRKTWQSFPRRPLPERPNIVLTRDASFDAPGAEIVPSMSEALAQAVRHAGPHGEACVIGGGEIYSMALDRADSLHITHVLAEPDGDTRFPEIDPALWQVVSSEDVPAGPRDSHATRVVVYHRRPR